MANVLIVDDDRDLGDAARALLEAAGHTVRVAHDGEEGLASLCRAPLPDCVLLDLDMPVLNGLGMAHQMLVHDAGEENIPIVLVSGRDDLRAAALHIGTPYFVAKASADYCETMLKTLERALIERRAPSSA